MEALGIDWKLIIAQVINFLILLFVLRKFLYQPVLKMMEERQAKITKGLADAAEAEKKLLTSEAESKKIEEKAYAEAEKLIKTAQQEASRSAEEIKAKAEKQAASAVAEGKAEASLLKEKAFGEAKKEISTLVLMAVEKVVGGELGQSQHRQLAESLVKEF